MSLRPLLTGSQEHPWVTKNGEDPLLSEEENCSEPIEVPNALEVNHAVTRRMSHLFCVVSGPKYLYYLYFTHL